MLVSCATWSCSTLACASDCARKASIRSEALRSIASIAARFFSASAFTASRTFSTDDSNNSSEAFRNSRATVIFVGSLATSPNPPNDSIFSLSFSPCAKLSLIFPWTSMDAAAAMTDTCLCMLLDISRNLTVSRPLMMSCVMKYWSLSRWQNARPSSRVCCRASTDSRTWPRYPLAATWFRMASQLWTFLQNTCASAFRV